MIFSQPNKRMKKAQPTGKRTIALCVWICSMMLKPERLSLFDVSSDLKLTVGLRQISDVQHHKESRDTFIGEEFPDDSRGTNRSINAVPFGEVSERKFCSTCQCLFDSRAEQMEHYKLDWHRFNLKQRLAGRPLITVEEFEKKAGMGDVSSISGSDSENDESHCDDDHGNDGVTSHGGRLPNRVLFQNFQGQYLCLYRCAFQSRVRDEVNLVESLMQISEKTMWVILMTGGGHFAGAVYQGKEVLQHKTFHRYTVRAKQGMAQSRCNAQNRGHAPKSAGSALRSYNEAALTKDIQELLTSWAKYLTQATAIFIRTPKYNKSVFFGGCEASLEKKDLRIHSIPFATRRATFTEIRRVHDILSTLHVYEKTTDVSFILSPKRCQGKPSSQITRNMAVVPQVDYQGEDVEDVVEEVNLVQLEMVDMTLSTLDLKDHEIRPTKKKRRKRKDRKPDETEKEENIMEQDQGCVQLEFSVRDALYTASKTGDTEMSQTFPQRETLAQHDSTAIDSAEHALLHVAPSAAQSHNVKMLLEAGSDPTCRNREGQTPSDVGADKGTRNMLENFMNENPNRSDCSTAQVFQPLSDVEKSRKAEKKKAQKAAKKQREIKKREERQKEEEEQEEKRKFLALNDQEKRALTAGRRLAEQIARTGMPVPMRRCFQCGESLLGKVPFEYLDFCFCSTECVRAHRKINATAKP